ITASADGSVRVWKIPEKPSDKVAEPRTLTGGKGPLRALIDLDGETVAAAGDAGTIDLWDVKEGKRIRSIHAHDAPILALAADEGPEQILTGSADRTAKLIAAATGKPLVTYRGHTGAVSTVTFARGKSGEKVQVVTGGAEGGIKVWEKDSGRG